MSSAKPSDMGLGLRTGACGVADGFTIADGRPVAGGMMRFSANLGFLWTELSLPEAIRAAGAAGFDAVECHWPFATDPGLVRDALAEAGLPMVALNTRPGDRARGEFGLAALAGREAEARAAIAEAVAYANAVGAGAVHVMGGVAEGPEAERVFVENLGFAGAEAGALTVLIEPINHVDVPGYFLGSVDRALDVLDKVAAPNLKLMVDCYHLARMGHDVAEEVVRLMPHTGHVQIAGHPGTGRAGYRDAGLRCDLRRAFAVGLDGVRRGGIPPGRADGEQPRLVGDLARGLGRGGPARPVSPRFRRRRRRSPRSGLRAYPRWRRC
jgi:hydroxypyruvate isomerase